MMTVANSAAILSEQTQRDLKSILETLDQRIYEIASGSGEEISEATGAAAELKALEALRGSTAAMLGADAG